MHADIYPERAFTLLALLLIPSLCLSSTNVIDAANEPGRAQAPPRRGAACD